jgi:hypothetical protein
MPDGTFHKMIAVEHEGAKIPKQNGYIDSETTPYIETKNNVSINGVSYKKKYNPKKMDKDNIIKIFTEFFTDEEKASFGFEKIGNWFFGWNWRYTPDPTFSGTKILFYNGRYYLLKIKNGLLDDYSPLERD